MDVVTDGSGLTTLRAALPVQTRSRRLAGWTREHWLGIALVLLVAAVTVLPIAFVVVNSFNVARPGQAWTPGLDGSLDEAGRMSGASQWQMLRRITLPLLAPAILTALLAGLIRSLEAFEIEQLLGTRAGIYVYATRIYDLINYEPPQFPQAMALSTAILGILFVLALLYQQATATRRYATVTGRGMSMRPLQA